MFFRSPIDALFSMLHVTSPFASSVDLTVNTSEPSATKMDWPGFTLLANEAYEQANFVASPLNE